MGAKRYTAPLVLSHVWGFDYAEMKEYRYHYGHTTRPIYTLGDYHWSAVPVGKKPPKHHSKGFEYEWELHTSPFAESIGWEVYKSKMD